MVSGKTQEISRGERRIDGDVQDDWRKLCDALGQSQRFSEDRGCRRLPTDTTVKNKAWTRDCGASSKTPEQCAMKGKG